MKSFLKLNLYYRDQNENKFVIPDTNLHSQNDSVQYNQGKDAILKSSGCHKPPNFVLPTSFRNVAPSWTSFQGKLNTLSL